MKDLLTYLFTSLADEKDGVVVEVTENDNEIMASAKVAPTDMGKIIGKKGRTINAVRTIAKVLAIKSKKRLGLELAETNDK